MEKSTFSQQPMPLLSTVTHGQLMINLHKLLQKFCLKTISVKWDAAWNCSVTRDLNFATKFVMNYVLFFKLNIILQLPTGPKLIVLQKYLIKQLPNISLHLLTQTQKIGSST